MCWFGSRASKWKEAGGRLRPIAFVSVALCLMAIWASEVSASCGDYLFTKHDSTAQYHPTVQVLAPPLRPPPNSMPCAGPACRRSLPLPGSFPISTNENSVEGALAAARHSGFVVQPPAFNRDGLAFLPLEGFPLSVRRPPRLVIL